MTEQNYTYCSSWKNPKTIIMLVGIVLLAGIIVVSILRDRIVQQNLWQINVVGQGKVTYLAEVAKISLGVQIDKASKAEDALKQLNDKMQAIIKALEASGVKAEDIQTQNYFLNPQYDFVNNVSRPAGYTANQSISIKVNGIDKNPEIIAKLIAVATKAGANQVSGVTFEPADLNSLKHEARLKAITDARSKAQEVSGSLSVRLDKVVGWWENVITSPDVPNTNYSYGVGMGGNGMGGGSASPVVPSGTREIILEVTLNYQIK